ncbi:MAG TPA: hypothetical protein VER17_07140 [Tepidisphaeraceae bacterium]|nr:hypothetical protein [Tepidisphaeraceae bacterium]
MNRQPLHAGWTVRAVGDLTEVPSPLRGSAVPAVVPGCVHTDLLRAGHIPDPYRDLNEYALTWIGRTDWQYRTTFTVEEQLFTHERIDLACDGLDTVARIELNGQLVAQTQNMHRSYRFDVRAWLKRGVNELTITFASPVRYAEAMRDKLGPLPYVNGVAGPFNFIRKMACNFGWDWGPALPTCGIWKGVRLEGWSEARIAGLRHQLLLVDHEQDTALVRFDINVQFSGGPPKRAEFPHHPKLRGSLEVFHEGHDPSDNARAVRDGWLVWVEENRVSFEAELQRPRPWWPRGHGQQPLRDLKFALAARDGTILDDYSTRIGLRTVALDTSPDDIGRKFVLKVNGKPIFCKGFNWIPDDCFLDRANEPARLRQRIQQAVDAGANMLRVWGGGIYETDEFYSICDELGVLVWQDFPFACAMYPEEEPFRSEVEAEVRDNVARIAHHPSLAIWNGCNENLWGYRDWGWKPQVQGRTWGKGYYFDLLPKLAKELTPTVPYWAGSPWSGDHDVDDGVHPNAATHGNKHVWEAWFKDDYAAYRAFEPRFCSEFGFQGPATYASIASVVAEAGRDFGSLAMRHHQKSGNAFSDQDDGDRRNLRHLVRQFNLPGLSEMLASLDPQGRRPQTPPTLHAPLHTADPLPSRVNFDDLHYLLQVNQARALTLGVEWFRSRQPTCMGTLYWQLNDCWPGVTSWSCIDGDGRPKPLWYATRRFFADVLWTFQPEPDGSLSLCAINDRDEPLEVRGTGAARQTFEGAVLAAQPMEFTVPPRGVHRQTLDRSVATPGDPSRELVHFGQDARSAFWFFVPDKAIRYPQPRFASHLRREGQRYLLRIEAETLLRDVCLFADRLDPAATVSEQLVTLLPGNAFTFVIESPRELTREQLTSPPVFRCANSFGNNA